MSDWTDGPPEVVRVLGARDLAPEECARDAALLGRPVAAGRRALVQQSNGKQATMWGRWRGE